MNAEIIAIGSELTTGAKLDTNSQWLSLELAGVGIPVDYHTTVADHLHAMLGVFQTAAQRADLVLITGGLGPTLDDLTRQALAELMQVPLELHEESLAYIEQLFAKRNREMPERNRIQAMFPKGSRPISNPRGTAPGVWCELPRSYGRTDCVMAAMPGVPSEMKRMFLHEVLPRLPGTGQVIRRACVNCFGVGESKAEEILGDLTERGRMPEVGITVHEATITLRITAQGVDEQDCQTAIAVTKTLIGERMNDLVFGEEDEELEHAVIGLLKARGLTLSTAESGTGGLLAHRLTEVSGFESSYAGGLIAPTDVAKHHLLGIAPETIADAGAVSSAVAVAMAEGCRERFGTNFSLAVTECPASDPDDPQADVPSAFVALSGAGCEQSVELKLGGDPAILKSRTAKAALNMLRLHLLRG